MIFDTNLHHFYTKLEKSLEYDMPNLKADTYFKSRMLRLFLAFKNVVKLKTRCMSNWWKDMDYKN